MSTTMKHLIQNILLLAILLVPATFIACSNEDTVNDQLPVINTYALTVQASKGSDVATARALSLSGTTLNATWAIGEAVTVYNVTKSADLGGTLSAQTNGSSTTLSGMLTGSIEVNDELTLKFLNPAYSTQDGTLTGNATSIDKVCDYATATVKVTAVSGGNVTTTAASFSNQQAIVKFTLKDKADGSTLLSATQLVVSAGGNSYTVTPTPAASELYVAISGISSQDVTLTATVGSDTYEYKKTEATFVNGKYYTINVMMTRLAKAADLGKVMAQNGCIYDNNAAATTAGTTAVGVIAYVGNDSGCQHGLALALADESGIRTFTKAGEAAGDHADVADYIWRVPTKTDWEKMTTYLTAHHQSLVNGNYWSSTTSGTDNAYCATISSGGDAIDVTQVQDKQTELNVRAVLAF